LEYPIVNSTDKDNAITPVAPPLALQLAEQQALVRFHQRNAYLTEERATELALLTGKLIDDDKQQPTKQLLGIASWIMGDRK